MNAASCIFCKISQGKLDSDIVFEDDHTIAFRDIRPRAPVHILVIPRCHISTINDLSETDEALVGKLFTVAKAVAEDQKIAESGYRVVMNCNDNGGQSVYHIHLHLLGGRRMEWPPG